MTNGLSWVHIAEFIDLWDQLRYMQLNEDVDNDILRNYGSHSRMVSTRRHRHTSLNFLGHTYLEEEDHLEGTSPIEICLSACCLLLVEIAHRTCHWFQFRFVSRETF